MMPPPHHLRILIADDERLARTSLRRALDELSDASVVSECDSGHTAEQAIRTLLPDVAFLDVDMPDRTGLDVVRSLGTAISTKIIFVTAYEEFALEAFQVHAFDYVLKPIDSDRVRLAAERAREQILLEHHGDGHNGFPDPVPAAAGETVQPHPRYLDRLTVQTGDRLTLVDVAEVDWVEAWGDYVRIHVHGRTFTIREKIGDLERQLDPNRFARVHRSTIVQIARIKDLAPLLHGDYELTLADNTLLRLSRTYRHRLSELLQHHL